jgi:hypothetical protein
VPTLISAVVVSMFAIVFLDTSSAPVGHPHGYGAPDAGIIGTFIHITVRMPAPNELSRHLLLQYVVSACRDTTFV